MTREEIKSMVADVIRDQVGIEDVSEEMQLEDDLTCDSLDRVEIAMDLEERLNIEISDAAGEACVTVKDVVDLVDSLLNPKEEVEQISDDSDKVQEVDAPEEEQAVEDTSK